MGKIAKIIYHNKPYQIFHIKNIVEILVTIIEKSIWVFQSDMSMCHENCNRCERDHGHDRGSIGIFYFTHSYEK
jgi:hypothetical protein